MAGNTEKIDEIVDRSAVSGQITSTTAELRELELALVDSLNGAVQLNAALGRAQTFRQYQQSATQAATATARLASEQAKAAITAQKLAQEEAKTAVANNKLALSNEQVRRAQEKATAAAEKARSEYQKLVKEFNDATAAAREAGVVFGTQSVEFTTAAERVRNLRGQLDAIDNPLGNFQRNVGNYANSIGGLFTRLYGYIRTAANIIPGLGISGIFLAAFEGLKYLAEQTGLFENKISNFRRTLDALNEVNKEADKQAGEQTTHLKYLYEAATDVANAQEKRLLAARELQKEFPNTFKSISAENIILGIAKDQYNLLTDAILKNARAKAAADKISDLESKKLDADVEIFKIRTAELAEQKKLQEDIKKGKFDLSGTGEAGGSGILEGNAAKQIHDRAVRAVKDQTDLKNSYIATQKAIEQSVGGATAIGNALAESRDNTPNPKKPKEDKSFDDRLEEQKRIEEAILASETNSYKERFDAIDAFEKNSDAIIKEGVKSKVYREQEGVNKIIAIDTEAAKQRIALQKKINADVDAQQKAALEQLKGNLAQEVLAFQDAQNQRLLEIDKERSKRASALADEYAKGKLSALKYNQELYNLDSAAAQQRIQVQIAAAEATVKAQAAAVALGFGNAKDLQNSTNQLARLQIQASDQVTENELNNIRKIEAARKQLADKQKEVASAALTLIQTVVDAGYTNQLNALQDQSDQIDKNADKEKAAIDRSNLSQQEKADKTKVLDAQVQAQKELIAQREKKIRQDQAKFDRAVSIARVIQETAVAVAQALTVPIVGIALAATIGALGAIQLATILATPLPKFAKGTMNSPEGYAHVGEQGVEGRIDPDGRFSLTPATDTVTYLKKGTKIIPHMQLMKAMAGEKLVYVGGQSVDMSEVVKAIRDNKPQKQQAPRINGWGRELRDMERYNNYRKSYFN